MKLSSTFQRVLQVLSSPGVSFAPSPALDSKAIEAPATSNVDVAIVGAGLSGLSAARALTAANKTVIVLEARDRVGGRVENHELSNGGITELGAAFVGPTQDRVLYLASELNLETFPEYDQGDNVNWSDNERSTHASNSPLPPYGRQPQNSFIVSVPAYSRIALHQLNVIFAALDRRAAELDVSAPWAHPKAAEWDAMTFGSWLLSDQWHWQARRLVDTITNALFSANPSELSYLYVLTYIASAGNETMTGTIERLVGVKDGGQESRIVGGTGLLATRMAEELGHSRILLNAPVQTISYNDSTSLYTVSSTGHTIMTKRVIVAMSPPLAARITYSPPLPASRDQLTQRMFMGSLGKAIAIYPTPFWRKSNLTGQALSDTGTTRTTFDVSPPDGSYGALLGFIEGDEMRSLDDASEAEMREKAQSDFVRYFGPEAADATEWVFKRWDNEPYSRGGPVALTGMGTLYKYGEALRRPCGGIHWAGTETSDYWIGYMDGAIRSGERVAKEILAS